MGSARVLAACLSLVQSWLVGSFGQRQGRKVPLVNQASKWHRLETHMHTQAYNSLIHLTNRRQPFCSSPCPARLGSSRAQPTGSRQSLHGDGAFYLRSMICNTVIKNCHDRHGVKYQGLTGATLLRDKATCACRSVFACTRYVCMSVCREGSQRLVLCRLQERRSSNFAGAFAGRVWPLDHEVTPPIVSGGFEKPSSERQAAGLP